MADRTVQVPVSLPTREQIAEALYPWIVGSAMLDAADAVLALLSQPAPTAEPFPYESGDERYRRVTGKEPPAHIDAITDRGNYWHDAEPTRIEDMARGTTFVGTTRDTNYTSRWTCVADGLMSGMGIPHDITEVDPSTIRDVTPPARREED